MVDVKKVTIQFSNGVNWTIADKHFDFKLMDNELKLVAKQKLIKKFITEPLQTRSEETIYG